MYADMPVSIQNRSDLYVETTPTLVSEGIHEAELVDVLSIASPFGQRAGLVFRLLSGPHQGIELMQSAAVARSPKGKLVDLLRGLGGTDGGLDTARRLVGNRCKVAVRHESNKAGTVYAAIGQTYC